MQLHLVDATFELFRAYYSRPAERNAAGQPVNAVRGLLDSMLSLLREPGVSHVAAATDHVIRSWRNEVYPGYKTEAGVPNELLDQFELAERALAALGVVVWPMVEFEADDAIATAVDRWAEVPDVERVAVCSVDKDLSQLVHGKRVVLVDRMRKITYDEPAVLAKFGVPPRSIPDYLALVGDSADGYPGLPGWGARSAAAVLARWERIEAIPDRASDWEVAVRNGPRLAATLAQQREEALLYKRLATLSLDAPIAERLEDLEWRGVPRDEFTALCDELGFGRVLERVHRWREGSPGRRG